MPKKSTVWSINTSIGAVDTFDSSAVYDSIDNYDDLPSGFSAITTVKPNTWSGLNKNSTQWLTNAQTIDSYDTTGLYDTTDSFDGTIGVSTITTRLSNVWSPSVKKSTTWIANRLSITGQRAYDSITLYDTTVKYDGNIVSKITTKIPTVWSTT